MTKKRTSTKLILKSFMLRALPGMITCAEFEQFIIDYLEGTLPKAQRQLFERHMKVCRECKDYLARYQLTQTLYTKQLQAEAESDLGEVPDDLVTAIIEASKTRQ